MTRGRKSKLTPEKQEIIVKALAEGQTKRASAALAGIDEASLYLWLAKGEKQGRGFYYDFYEACKKAIASAESRLVNAVHRSAEGGVFRLKMYDEDGNQLFREDGVTPKYKSVVMRPDGRLGMQLLAVRNPRDWSGKQPQDLPPEQAGEGTPAAILDLFAAAYFELQKLGVRMPTNDDDLALPPTEFRPVHNGPTGEPRGLPAIEDLSGLPPTTPRSLA
jgi:hypothetical protein